MGCTSPSSGLPISYGAPQAVATSPSPVPSTTTPASITTGPDLVSNTTRRPEPSSSGSVPEANEWNSIRTPDSSAISSRDNLNSSGSKGTVYPVRGEGARQPPRPMSRSSRAHSTPATTGSPSP
ncbi:hypothetical protein EV562_101566 [Streptomyces sp. BK208]|nr:hypothetical protein EV562_101566 [Streptomyces sp. BK208]